MSTTTNEPNNGYTPAKVWTMPNEDNNGGKFAATNRPTAGARHEQTLPVGDAPLQLYSLNTPNGIKVNIMLEELAECGIDAAKYDAYKINIMEGDQFGSDFVDINPNSKIPALVDYSVSPPVKLFESGAILMYLAEKFAKFIPVEQGQKRATCLSWVMWQMGSAPYLGGGFGHFYAYAPYPMQYPIDRFTMETKRQLDVLDQHLANHEYFCAPENEQGEQNYSIADMIIWAWYGQLVLGKLYDAAEFLDVASYKNVQRWAQQIAKRPAVKRAVAVELKSIKDERENS
ncbi:glutathione-dependent disulfide-bond oxidoreductase [Psychrobacter sp. I-STPA10]|uniref:glutathione-dependent disulfide-bond oxidoreductase n=1 Tax=Psychrobacter sp. I-STPA10 TaxID=2585769 RepID=UPI001E3203CA|nr:glutathione-dependent disulfide-bond oxidoreductase [Psychrobacter sp. I-STPA10]